MLDVVTADAPSDSEDHSLPPDVYSDGRLLWRAKPGAESTFADNVAARDLLRALHKDQFWNPWQMEEHAAELVRAELVMEEWERAELDFKPMTQRQINAMFARWDREDERDRDRGSRQRTKNLGRYDAERAEARLQLLEQQHALAHETREVTHLRTGELYPKLPNELRAKQIATLDEKIEVRRSAVERLSVMVGDPENVPDEHGYLPRDRRLCMLSRYQDHRIAMVREIRALLPDMDARIAAATDRGERSKLKNEHAIKERQLDALLAIPRLEAEDMCADCATPADRHGYDLVPAGGPCPAWPGQRELRAKVRDLLESFQQNDDNRPPQSSPVKAKPLAVLPSGLPIAEVILRLQDLQARHPNSEVRRGRANRWELWPDT